MLNKYKDSQKFFYDYFNHINDTNHISHAYMIETNGVSYAFNLALDLAKFFLCNGVYDEKICTLVDSGNYSNLKVIGSEGLIKKEDIISLKNDFSMKSIDNKKQVYILRDVQNMNKSAANSLLKFLEEPEDDVIAILLCDSSINVLSTLVSRCQIINLINDDNVYNSIFISLYENDSDIRYDDFVNSFVKKFYDIYLDFETKGVSILINNDIYGLKDCFKEFLSFGYYLYFDVLNSLLSRNVCCSSFDINLQKIAENNDSRDIIRKMEIIDKFIYDLKFNVNMNLFIDNFFISMGCV